MNGRYRVEEVAGRGGMSVVLRATQIDTNTPVALKVLLPERRERRKDVERLLREARLIAQLASPHAARLFEAGTFVDDGVEVPFLALEYVDGVDLATWMRARGPVPTSSAVDIVLQACHALGEAHARGLVHRDIKPSNLMLTATAAGQAFVKVLDFGIAREIDEHDARLTTTGDIVGSPTYMAPEQMRPDATLDPRADVWSLGIVLYELVAGRLPFVSSSLPDLCLQVMFEEPAPLPADCPAELAAVIERCLRKEPRARFATAHEVGDVLRALAATSLPFTATDLELATVDGLPAGTDAQVTPEPPVRTPRRGARAVIAAGVVASALVAWRLAPAASESHPVEASATLTNVAAPPAILSPVSPPAVVTPSVDPVQPPVAVEPPRTRPSKATPPRRTHDATAAVTATRSRVTTATETAATDALVDQAVAGAAARTSDAPARDPLASPF